jgi:hypothetical protein
VASALRSSIGAHMSLTYRPQIIVSTSMPQSSGRNRHSIVHVTFGRIVSQDTIDDDTDFSICEPAVRSEARLGLDSRCRHEEE